MPSNPDWATHRTVQRADDILTAIRRIQTYVQGISSDQYLQNNLVRDAVTRQVLIIAEACTRIRDLEERAGIDALARLSSRQPDVDWHAISAIGNVIRHAYGDEDPCVIRDVVFGEDLSVLQSAIFAEFPLLNPRD